MMQILREQLPCQEDQFRAAAERYRAALAEHAQSVGQPAPWPEYEELRVVAQHGFQFEVVDPAPPPPPPQQFVTRLEVQEAKRGVLRQRIASQEAMQLRPMREFLLADDAATKKSALARLKSIESGAAEARAALEALQAITNALTVEQRLAQVTVEEAKAEVENLV